MVNVRNFYIKARVDGRVNDLCGGPKAKDGGMGVIISQRYKNQIVTACEVKCEVIEGGKLRTQVINDYGEVVYTHVSTR